MNKIITNNLSMMLNGTRDGMLGDIEYKTIDARILRYGKRSYGISATSKYSFDYDPKTGRIIGGNEKLIRGTLKGILPGLGIGKFSVKYLLTMEDGTRDDSNVLKVTVESMTLSGHTKTSKFAKQNLEESVRLFNQLMKEDAKVE